MEVLPYGVEATGIITQTVFPAGRFENEIKANGLRVGRRRLVLFLPVEPVRASTGFGEGELVRFDLFLDVVTETFKDAVIEVMAVSGDCQ